MALFNQIYFYRIKTTTYHDTNSIAICNLRKFISSNIYEIKFRSLNIKNIKKVENIAELAKSYSLIFKTIMAKNAAMKAIFFNGHDAVIVQENV